MKPLRISLIVLLVGVVFAVGAAASRSESTHVETDGSVLFIENVGQFASDARYQIRSSRGTAWLSDDSVWLTAVAPVQPTHSAPSSVFLPENLRREVEPDFVQRRSASVQIQFPGASPTPRIEPFTQLDTAVSYFSGSQPDQWYSRVPVWGGVRYVDLYPGIDLVLSGEQGAITPRFVCHANCEHALEQVQLAIEGAEAVQASANSIQIDTAVGPITFPLFEIVDQSGGVLDMSEQVLNVDGYGRVRPFAAEASPRSIEAPEADHDTPFTAETFLSTYLGGSGYEWIQATAVGPANAIYIVGSTDLAAFPTAVGPSAIAEDEYALVAQLNPEDGSPIFLTFIADATPFGIDVDRNGRVYIAGRAYPGFPTTDAAFDQTISGRMDAFMMKLATDGASLLYSTVLGGDRADIAYDLAIDNAGNAYVGGMTNSYNYPTTSGAFDTTFSGLCDYKGEYYCPVGFVTKVSPNGRSLVYSTYLGGENQMDSFGDGIHSIAIDAQGHAYVTGYANSLDFPTTSGAFSEDFTEGLCVTSGLLWGYRCYETFVTKLSIDGGTLVYSTFLGGEQDDEGMAIAVDDQGHAYVTGYSSSPQFPTTPDAFATELSGGTCDYHTRFTSPFPCPDAFVTKLNATGSGLAYSTFLGGDGDDTYTENGRSLVVDTAYNITVGGYTTSSSFPLTTGAANKQPNRLFITQLNANGMLAYSSYIGGTEYGSGLENNSLALFPDSSLLIGIDSFPAMVPTTAGAYQPSPPGASDITVLHMDIRDPDPNAGWLPVGSGAAEGGGISNNSGESGWPSMAVAPDESIYVAWYDRSTGNKEIYVRRWNGTTWEEVGASSAHAGGISNNAGASTAVSLGIAPDGTLYAAWQDNTSGNDEIYVKRWNGSTWQEVGSGSATGGGISDNSGHSTHPSLAVDIDGTPYIAWHDDSGGNDDIYIRRWNGTVWQEVGTHSAAGGGISNDASASYTPSIATAPDGEPYVAWQNKTAWNSDIFLRRWNGTAWVSVGTGSATGGGISNSEGQSVRPALAFAFGDSPTIAWVDDTSGNREVYVKRHNGTGWVDIGNGSSSGAGISLNVSASNVARLAAAPDGTPYVGWYDGFDGDDEIYVRRWNGVRWEEIGVGSATGGGISDNAGNSGLLALAIDDSGIPTIAWGDYSSGNFEIYVRRGGTPPCYLLTRMHTGSGSDPVATPSQSYGCPAGHYAAGTSIALEASPSPGWQVGTWSGTSNDNSRSLSNSLTMPSQPYAVGVNYIQLAHVQFASSAFAADEGDPTAVIDVTLSGTHPDTVSVHYETRDNTAVAGSDYTAVAGTLTFAPNETHQSFTIPILDDTAVEDDETITLLLSEPEGCVLGSQATSQLTIRDNDSPVATPTPEPEPEYRVYFAVTVSN